MKRKRIRDQTGMRKFKDTDDGDLRRRAISAAKRIYQKDGEVEIDDDAKLSIGGDPGFYVAAWVWVDDSDVDPPVEEEEDDE